jgi:hypothetical protein
MAAKRKHNLAIKKTPEPDPQDQAKIDLVRSTPFLSTYAPISGNEAGPMYLLPPELDEAVQLLKRMLEGMRVKTILSHKHGCCMSCNYPHILGVCRRNCVCHEAKTYLEARGIKVDI